MYLSNVTDVSVVWLLVTFRIREVCTSILYPDLIPRVLHGFPQHFRLKYWIYRITGTVVSCKIHTNSLFMVTTLICG
jgi:hypothetical protein